MATPRGADDSADRRPQFSNRYSAIEALLHKTPQEFQFFQAVRLLERLYPDRAPVGRFVSPSKEVVRFLRARVVSLSGQPDSEYRLGRMARGAAPRMVINFMGLTGPSGVLPLYYTELIVERLRQKDRAMLRLFRYLQPSHGFAVLSGVGEVSLRDRL